MDTVDISNDQTETINNAAIDAVHERAHRLFDSEIPTEARYCVRCGEEIPVERLRAIPGTKYCIFCKEKLEKGL